jgi:hypothetical protein
MSAGVVADDEHLADAAYALALRITRDERRAAASVESALERVADGPVAFLNAVRDEGRLRRAGAPDPLTAPRPANLSGISFADWAVLERVALRGFTVTEAADALGIERREALLRLNRGLVAAGRFLRDRGQTGDDANALRLHRLDRDRAAGGLDDPAGDREPEAGAASRIAR